MRLQVGIGGGRSVVALGRTFSSIKGPRQDRAPIVHKFEIILLLLLNSRILQLADADLMYFTGVRCYNNW